MTENREHTAAEIQDDIASVDEKIQGLRQQEANAQADAQTHDAEFLDSDELPALEAAVQARARVETLQRIIANGQTRRAGFVADLEATERRERRADAVTTCAISAEVINTLENEVSAKRAKLVLILREFAQRDAELKTQIYDERGNFSTSFSLLAPNVINKMIYQGPDADDEKKARAAVAEIESIADGVSLDLAFYQPGYQSWAFMAFAKDQAKSLPELTQDEAVVQRALEALAGIVPERPMSDVHFNAVAVGGKGL